MSTDTIRERSTAALAEALHTANGSGCLHEDGYGGTGWVQCDKEASWAMECSPTLAADIDLATAWREAVAALPEGALTMNLTAMGGMPFVAEAWNVLTFAKVAECFGPTPTDALLALAEKLKEATR